MQVWTYYVLVCFFYKQQTLSHSTHNIKLHAKTYELIIIANKVVCNY